MATVHFFNGTQSGTADGSYADPYDLTQLSTQEGSATSGDIFIFKDGTYGFSSALSFASAITTTSLTYRAESDRGVTFSSTSTFVFGNTNLTAGQTYNGFTFNGSSTTNDLFTWNQSSSAAGKAHTFNDCDLKGKTFGENLGLSTRAKATFNRCVFEQTGTASFWFEHRNGTSASLRAELDFVHCTLHNRTGTGSNLYAFNRCTVDAKNTIIFDYNNTITNVVNTSSSINLSGPCDLIRADGTSISSDANNIAQDPQFVDQVNGDFRLRPSSPCIGAATTS